MFPRFLTLLIDAFRELYRGAPAGLVAANVGSGGATVGTSLWAYLGENHAAIGALLAILSFLVLLVSTAFAMLLRWLEYRAKTRATPPPLEPSA